MISMILAVNHSPGFPIGATNESGEAVVPWPHCASVSEDMKHFMEITSGKMVMMGRKTWESLGIQKPLKHRHNIVITRDPATAAEINLLIYPTADTKCDAFTSIDEFINNDICIEQALIGEVIVIGGAEMYEQLLPYCGRIYLTTFYFDKEELIKPDTFLPEKLVEIFEGKDEGWKQIDKEIIMKESAADLDFTQTVKSGPVKIKNPVGAIFTTYERQ